MANNQNENPVASVEFSSNSRGNADWTSNTVFSLNMMGKQRLKKANGETCSFVTAQQNHTRVSLGKKKVTTGTAVLSTLFYFFIQVTVSNKILISSYKQSILNKTNLPSECLRLGKELLRLHFKWKSPSSLFSYLYYYFLLFLKLEVFYYSC